MRDFEVAVRPTYNQWTNRRLHETRLVKVEWKNVMRLVVATLVGNGLQGHAQTFLVS